MVVDLGTIVFVIGSEFVMFCKQMMQKGVWVGYGIIGTHSVILMKSAMYAKHVILGTNGGTSRLEMGQPSIEPSTKLEGSFMSIHRPSNCTLEWN